MSRVSHSPDRLRVTFDDEGLVTNAGLLVVTHAGCPAGRGVNRGATVRMAGLVGGARPGRKVLTLVHSIAAVASHIDHADVLRARETAGVLGHRVMAPSTLGIFLRAFSFGHVRQLESVVGKVLARAWALGAGPGNSRLVIDVDFTHLRGRGQEETGRGVWVHESFGISHPILATRADTGDHPRPDAQRLGEYFPRSPALHRRDRRPAASCGRRRRDRDAIRFGVLVQRHPRRSGSSPRALHDGRADQHQRRR